jgi:hypothetical protein
MFLNFQTYFYMKTLVDYDYHMKKKLTHWYILVFYPFESIKNLVTIGLSSYFHILEAKVGHMFSCTCISKNVFKWILKYVIF